MVSRFVGLLV
ncbi:hypothetical protein E2C01_095390 [Portunus trituberculatus]|uniref:Uncharacterized protein n=1 Tax=Portunus trituberculatus TaxID=210409 RepID=A0A5B7K010_PORTR|nr:hypothetical protein [Portunus trituberculatus]